MVDSGDEFFYKNVIDTSSDEVSDDDLLTAAALLIHEHNLAQIPVYRGSLPGCKPALDRKSERGHEMLYDDYFRPNSLFTPELFRRRFRMSRPLFERIMDGVKVYDDYFICKEDAIGKVERDDSLFDKDWEGRRELVYPQAHPTTFQEILHLHHEICDQTVHNQLQADLVEHMWAHVGNNAGINNNKENNA